MILVILRIRLRDTRTYVNGVNEKSAAGSVMCGMEACGKGNGRTGACMKTATTITAMAIHSATSSCEVMDGTRKKYARCTHDKTPVSHSRSFCNWNRRANEKRD